jgi:putative membrane protein
MSTTPSPESADRFQVRPTSDSHFGWIRTRLSVERTMMAWIRTSVSLIGFGFTIVQFFQKLNDMAGVLPARRPEAPRYLGLMLIGAGLVSLLISCYQYRRIIRYLWGGSFRVLAGETDTADMPPVMQQSAVMAVAIAVFCIGLYAFGAVLLRFV